MKKILGLALAGALSVAALPAMAADRPLPYKAPPLVDPIFNWTGFYVGVNAGYSWGDTRINYDLVPLAATLNPSSFIGGGQVGFNWQMGNIVWGLEADLAWRNGKDNLTHAFGNGIDFTTFHVEQNWVGTLRPRLGVANNNWLFYVTGGLAFGGLRHSYTEFRAPVPAATRTANEDVSRAGWTVGGGVEVGINQHLSLGLEYLYMNFGSSTLSFPAQVVGGVAFPVDSTRFRDTSQVVRAKLNWRM
jgi:outer membrane immunogenic protein